MTVLAPARTSVEIWTAQPVIPRALAALEAFTRAAPADLEVQATTTYNGRSDWLLLWGPGEAQRAAGMRRQAGQTGRHAIALDLAYWNRGAKVRVTVDAPHPQAWVMRRDWPAARLAQDPPGMADFWRLDGPILIAGVGKKAQHQYGAQAVTAWEEEMAAACRRRWPGRPIVRRPKKPVTVPIERALVGASLLITWHSNAAVDAIRLGIPVVCRDGAAAAVCPSTLPEGDPAPLAPALRARFLRNLAWFQWDPAREAAECWVWLRELLA